MGIISTQFTSAKNTSLIRPVEALGVVLHAKSLDSFEHQIEGFIREGVEHEAITQDGVNVSIRHDRLPAPHLFKKLNSVGDLSSSYAALDQACVDDQTRFNLLILHFFKYQKSGLEVVPFRVNFH